jgi:hypothetical protein
MNQPMSKLLVVGLMVLAASAIGCGGKRADRPTASMAAPTDATFDEPAVYVRAPDLVAGSAGAPDLVGRRVRIQFRRDAVGLAGPTPLGADAPSTPGRTTSLDGTLTGTTNGWLVLRGQGKTYWIPQAAVLLIEVEQ